MPSTSAIGKLRNGGRCTALRGGDHQASERGVIGKGEHAPVSSHAAAAASKKTNARGCLGQAAPRRTLGASYQAGKMVSQTCEEATMSTERREWTKFVEQREREAKAKQQRAKQRSGPTPEELEAALDDLTTEARAIFDRTSEIA